MQKEGIRVFWLRYTNVRPGNISDHLKSRLHIPLAFNYPSIWECHLPTNLSLLIMENANTQKMGARGLCSATHKIAICFRANACTYTRWTWRNALYDGVGIIPFVHSPCIWSARISLSLSLSLLCAGSARYILRCVDREYPDWFGNGSALICAHKNTWHCFYFLATFLRSK